MTAIFQTLAYIFGDMLNSVGAAGKVFEYLDRKPQVSTEGTLKPDQLTGHVSFRHLNFAYPASPNKTVLQVRSDRQVDKSNSLFEFGHFMKQSLKRILETIESDKQNGII